MNVTVSSTPSGTAGKGCVTAFLSIFAIMGLVFTVFIAKAGFETVRPYFWEKTDCVIESSAASEKGDSNEFTVRYAYRFDGRNYTGTRFRTGMSPSMNAASAERAAQRYAAGSRVTCYVNSSSPGESTLERSSLWSLLFMLIPLVFVAVGVGGIIGVWRAKSVAQKAVSERHRKGVGNPIFLRLIGLVFILIGGGLIYVLVIRPTVKEIAAWRWTQVPCEIISSSVAAHSGSKSST